MGEGAVNMCKLQSFMDSLLGEETTAKDFLRIKGVLNIKGSEDMYILQCVHMVMNEEFKRPWADQTRENRIIFIGRGMQQRRQMLTDGVKACITAPLRFEIGAEIMARTGESYEAGNVLRHWDELNAYRIKLKSG